MSARTLGQLVAAVTLGIASLAGAPPASAEPPEPAPASSAAVGVINVNTATEAELVRLPGVGPARAQAILALRAQRGGRFRQLEELLRVRGIGRATFRRLRPHLTLDGPSTLAPPAPRRAGAAAP